MSLENNQENKVEKTRKKKNFDIKKEKKKKRKMRRKKKSDLKTMNKRKRCNHDNEGARHVVERVLSETKCNLIIKMPIDIFVFPLIFLFVFFNFFFFKDSFRQLTQVIYISFLFE